jgi:hypothetical protein
VRPCTACGEPIRAASATRGPFGTTVAACGVCGTEERSRPSSRRLVDPDWAALAPKAKLRYADDTPMPISAPDALVPFRVERARARLLLREWARRRWFAPREFRRIDESASFRGAFLPYWVWQARTRSSFRAARGDRYWARAGGNRVRAIRWRPAAGTVERRFAEVAVAATVRLEGRALADLMRDWRLAGAVPFTPELLAGYWVQRYDLEPEVGLELAKARMAAEVEREVRERVGGDDQYVARIDTAYAGLAYQLVLLPVWLVSYAHRGRRRMVAVHGESGRVVGERPWSAAKLLFAALLMLTMAGVILYFGRLSVSCRPPGPPDGIRIVYAMDMLYGLVSATLQVNRACSPQMRPAHPGSAAAPHRLFRERL